MTPIHLGAKTYRLDQEKKIQEKKIQEKRKGILPILLPFLCYLHRSHYFVFYFIVSWPKR